MVWHSIDDDSKIQRKKKHENLDEYNVAVQYLGKPSWEAASQDNATYV